MIFAGCVTAVVTTGGIGETVSIGAETVAVCNSYRVTVPGDITGETVSRSIETVSPIPPGSNNSSHTTCRNHSNSFCSIDTVSPVVTATVTQPGDITATVSAETVAVMSPGCVTVAVTQLETYSNSFNRCIETVGVMSPG